MEVDFPSRFMILIIDILPCVFFVFHSLSQFVEHKSSQIQIDLCWSNWQLYIDGVNVQLCEARLLYDPVKVTGLYRFWVKQTAPRDIGVFVFVYKKWCWGSFTVLGPVTMGSSLGNESCNMLCGCRCRCGVKLQNHKMTAECFCNC